jgi:hypothetical protein
MTIDRGEEKGLLALRCLSDSPNVSQLVETKYKFIQPLATLCERTEQHRLATQH